MVKDTPRLCYVRESDPVPALQGAYVGLRDGPPHWHRMQLEETEGGVLFNAAIHG